MGFKSLCVLVLLCGLIPAKTSGDNRFIVCTTLSLQGLVSGSGSDPDGAITAYSWSSPGGEPGSSTVATPGSVTYPTNSAGCRQSSMR